MMSNTTHIPSSACTAVIGAMTIAMKAQRILAHNAIRSEVIKIPGSANGCIYGIRFAYSDLVNVRYALTAGGIAVKEYLR